MPRGKPRGAGWLTPLKFARIKTNPQEKNNDLTELGRSCCRYSDDCCSH